MAATTIHMTPDKPSVLQIRKREPTILLLGETGAGKTAFMSLLKNLFRGRGPLELEDMHDKKAESGSSKSESQTTTPTLYAVTASDGLNFGILDTPGFADTRGLDLDDSHKAEIGKAIKEKIEAVDAILILANGTNQRLGAATRYTLETILSMFPNSIVDSIGFIFTHTDLDGLNFQRDVLPGVLRQSNYWAIQNPLGRLNAFNLNNGSAGQLKPSQEQKLRMDYDETVETLNKWLKWLDDQPITPTEEIRQLYDKTTALESNINASLSSMTRLSENRKKWTEIAADLGDTKRHKDALAAAIKQQTALFWDCESSEHYNTICIAADCHSNCHAPCKRAYVTSPRRLRYICSAFPWFSSSCRVCNHEAKYHRRYKYTHVQKRGELDEETSQQWASAHTEEEKLQAAQNAAQKELANIEAEVGEIQDEIHRLIGEYSQLALKRSTAGPIGGVLEMLSHRKSELQSKDGTDAELKLVDDTIAKIELMLGVDEERPIARGTGREFVSAAGSFARSAGVAARSILVGDHSRLVGLGLTKSGRT